MTLQQSRCRPAAADGWRDQFHLRERGPTIVSMQFTDTVKKRIYPVGTLRPDTPLTDEDVEQGAGDGQHDDQK
jgi:hypothetical protein